MNPMTSKKLSPCKGRYLNQRKLFALLAVVAVRLSCPAQIEPCSIGLVMLGASGPTGQLYYFREYYEGTFCSNEDGLIACIVQGDYHADDIYFPDPGMKWL
jgi:hypothetical protein